MKKIYCTFFCALIALCLLCSAKHRGPSYDVKPRIALDNYAVEIAKKHNLKFLNSGLGDMAGAKKAPWCLSLVSRQLLDFEQSRELVKDITFQLLFKMYNNKLFANYCKKSNCELHEDLMSFRLAFWDQNMDRPLYPYLSQVCLRDSKLYYYYADPNTQALLEPTIVSLEQLNLPSYKK